MERCRRQDRSLFALSLTRGLYFSPLLIIFVYVVYTRGLPARACAHCHTPNNIARVRVSADMTSVSKEYRPDTLKYAWGEFWIGSHVCCVLDS